MKDVLKKVNFSHVWLIFTEKLQSSASSHCYCTLEKKIFHIFLAYVKFFFVRIASS